jgi:protocatechuate 3,4-dioxygenase beta subunit
MIRVILFTVALATGSSQRGFREAVPNSALGAAKQSGVITGKILADDGKPIANIRVVAIAASEDPTQRNPTRNAEMLSLGRTDADGKYRLENLPAGRYYIVADSLDSPIFYPGVTVAAGAQIVTLEANAVLEKQDFQLKSPFAFRVRGRVIRPEGEAGGMQVSLSTGGAAALITTTAADGSFEFPTVRPATYQVRVVLRPNNFSPVSVTVNKDISDLELRAP